MNWKWSICWHEHEGRKGQGKEGREDDALLGLRCFSGSGGDGSVMVMMMMLMMMMMMMMTMMLTMYTDDEDRKG